MPNVDTSSGPDSDGSSAPQSAALDGSQISLPNKGECFTEAHLPLIRRMVTAWLRNEFRGAPELNLITGEGDLSEQILREAMAASVIHTNATALLRKLTQHRLADAFRGLSARHRSIAGSIDDEQFCIADWAEYEAPTAHDVDHEAALSLETVDFLMWGMPEAQPHAAAAFSHYLSRAGPDALSLKEVCERAPRGYAGPLRKLYRQWINCFEFPEANRRHLIDLLAERPELPLTRTHYFYAADCDHHRVGPLVQKALVISRHSNVELRKFVRDIQHRALVRSRFTASDWRNTEMVYFANREHARQEAVLLSEFF